MMLTNWQILKNHSFRFYLYSCIAGTFASGLAYIVTIWMIVNLHTSINATLTGMLLFWIPGLILSPHLGVIVDHYDRKKLIILAESTRVVMFIIFGLLLHHQQSLWVVYLLLILSGCFSALYQPLLPAFVHELVPNEQLLYANAIISMAYEFGNIIGRGIITVAVLSLLGTYGALFVVAALYFISAITIVPVQRHHTAINVKSIQRTGILKSIHDGYAYLFSNKKLLLYSIIQGAILMSLMAAPVLVGPYVKTVLQAGNRVFGLSEAAISSGAIAGAFFWSHLSNHIAKEKCLVIASSVACFSYLTLAYNNEIHLAFFAFIMLGFSWGSYALIMSAVQTLTDKNYQGRVQATISALVTIVFIIFSIFLYSANQTYNSQNAFIFLAVLCVFIITITSYQTWNLTKKVKQG